MKIKKGISILLSLLLTMSFVSTTANATEEIIPISECAGVVKPGKTYSISSTDEFLMFESLNNNFDGVTIVLTDDIMINKGTFSIDNKNQLYYNENPMSDVSEIVETNPVEEFNGTFDGQNHIISGVYISKEDSAGLFKVCNNATIKNVSIENSLIKGTQSVGSICGYAYNTTFQNCICNAIVVGENEVGGIAGTFDGNLTSCLNKGTVVGEMTVGGIAGMVMHGSMYQSGNSGAVFGDEFCGGFAGGFYGGDIEACFNSGDIHGGSVGGFIGLIAAEQHATLFYVPDSLIKSCYSCGNIYADEYGKFCYSCYGDFSLFYACYFEGELADSADYGGNLKDHYDMFCDNAASFGSGLVPSFYITAVNGSMLKKSDKQHTLFGCSDYVEDVGNENKGYMIPEVLHSVHVWGEYAYNNDATCVSDGTKTATCSAYGCNKKHTVSDTDHPKTEHDFSNWDIAQKPTTLNEGLKERKCDSCGVIETFVIPKLAPVKKILADTQTIYYKNTAYIESRTNNPDNVCYSVTWSSSDEEIATVKSGEITGLRFGKTTITCTVTDEFGNVSRDTCVVKVRYSFVQWFIMIFLFGWIWY